MAFVAKSSNDRLNLSANNEVGPGYYVGQPKFNVSKGYAPFSSLVERFEGSQKKRMQPQKKQNSFIPGPGAYNISGDFLKEKIIVSNVQNDVKIIEVPKETSVFKSKTKKFAQGQQTKDLTPGPGFYTDDIVMGKKSVKSPKNSKETKENKPKSVNLINSLMLQDKKRLIPSIPGKHQAFGYTETEKNELFLNQNPLIKYSGQGKDQVGPGQYNSKGCFDKDYVQGSTWVRSKVKKLNNEKCPTSEAVGPGSYEPKLDFESKAKMLESSVFKSKIGRSESFEGRREGEGREGGAGKEEGGREGGGRREGGLKRLVERGEEEEFLPDIEEIEVEKPGPTSYFKQGAPSSFKQGKQPVHLQNFGCSASRFIYEEDEGSKSVGPGDYNPKIDINTMQTKPKVKIPFITNVKRFDIKESEEPGPGFYDTHQNFEDKLIRNIKKGYKGNFGSLQTRFQDESLLERNDDMPGPGSYIDPNKKNLKDSKYFKSVFKSKTKREAFSKTLDTPAVGEYELNHFDIFTSNSGLLIDPSLQIKKPAFSTSQARFSNGKTQHKNGSQTTNETLKPTEREDLDNIKSQLNKGKKIIKNTQFSNKSKRFNYRKNEGPGPGQYGKEGRWLKESYNILFANI